MINAIIKLLKVLHNMLEKPSPALGGDSWVQDVEEFIRVLEGKGILFCDYSITFSWVV